MKAKILEIFSSMQGEGLFVGAKQIFVRFAQCNMTCAYCDTNLSRASKDITVKGLVNSITALDKKKGAHHSVSLTGGEPLLHAEFLEALLPELKDLGFKIYLETNGTLPDKLASIIDFVDIIAMDIKLPSATGMKPLWREHKKFLECAVKNGKKVFVKMVVASGTDRNELAVAAKLIENVDREIPVCVQPVTPAPESTRFVSVKKMRECRSYLEGTLKYVRVVPQMHKLLNIR